MDCQRLNKLIRGWYVQVQDETLAPARMVEFMENHILQCDTCLMDANVRDEIKKITAIVLPPSKMTKPGKVNRPTEIPPGYPPPPEPMEPPAAATPAEGAAKPGAETAAEGGAEPVAETAAEGATEPAAETAAEGEAEGAAEPEAETVAEQGAAAEKEEAPEGETKPAGDDGA